MHVVHFKNVPEQGRAHRRIGLGRTCDRGDVRATGTGNAAQPVEQVQPGAGASVGIDWTRQMLHEAFSCAKGRISHERASRGVSTRTR
jgi:hypothetical protein